MAEEKDSAGLGLTPVEDVKAQEAKRRAGEDDEYETGWREDEAEPLTDAVRAARLKRAQQMSAEGEEFASAFSEEPEAKA